MLHWIISVNDHMLTLHDCHCKCLTLKINGLSHNIISNSFQALSSIQTMIQHWNTSLKENTIIRLSVSQSTPSFLLLMTFKDLFSAWDKLTCQHTEILANNYLNWNFIQLIHTWSLHYLKAWSLFINLSVSTFKFISCHFVHYQSIKSFVSVRTIILSSLLPS